MKRILISTSSFGTEDRKPLDLLKSCGFDIQLNPYGRKLTKEETIELTQGIDGVIAGTEAYSFDILERASRLRVISRCGAGIDGIDTSALNAKNIKLFTTPDVHTNAVAELALAGLMALLRKIPLQHERIKHGGWDKLMGSNLSGKTIGLIGYGRVGRRFHRLLIGFDCRFLIYDPMCAENIVDKVELLEDLLKASDVISLHIPLSSETKNIISTTRMTQLKPDVILLNTSRGGLVDEEGLYKFLLQHPQAGVFLDVFSEEPYKGNLSTLPNAVLTPHIGTFTRETRVRMEVEAAENIIHFFNSNG